MERVPSSQRRSLVFLKSDNEAVCEMKNFETRRHRHIAPENKARLVLEFLQSKSPASSLCKKYRISQSIYYRWKKTFIRAGIEALRRQPRRRNHNPGGISKRQKTAAAIEAAKEELRRAVEALRSSDAERKPKLTDTARPVLSRAHRNRIDP